MKVIDLKPGTEINLGGPSGVHIATVTPHPLFPTLSLVIWVLSDGSTSLDALSLDQEIGPQTGRDRQDALRWSLLPGTRGRVS